MENKSGEMASILGSLQFKCNETVAARQSLREAHSLMEGIRGLRAGWDASSSHSMRRIDASLKEANITGVQEGLHDWIATTWCRVLGHVDGTQDRLEQLHAEVEKAKAETRDHLKDNKAQRSAKIGNLWGAGQSRISAAERDRLRTLYEGAERFLSKVDEMFKAYKRLLSDRVKAEQEAYVKIQSMLGVIERSKDSVGEATLVELVITELVDALNTLCLQCKEDDIWISF